MRTALKLLTMMLVTACLSCGTGLPRFVTPGIETRFAFFNFSKEMYAVLGMRVHNEEGSSADFVYTPLLPPGGAYRESFSSFVDSDTPDALDLRILLYRRVNVDEPIGLDDGEAVESTPIAAGELIGVPAGSVQILETFTIANWEAPEGTAKVKIAQCSVVDQDITNGLLADTNGVWEVSGVEEELASTRPPALAEMSPIKGRVVLADGDGVAGIGVLLRTRFRTRLDCADAGNEDDAGYGEPIDFTVTDSSGRFQVDRPPGVYQIEFFSDDYAFRPGIMRVETPQSDIEALAEPM